MNALLKNMRSISDTCLILGIFLFLGGYALKMHGLCQGTQFSASIGEGAYSIGIILLLVCGLLSLQVRLPEALTQKRVQVIANKPRRVKVILFLFYAAGFLAMIGAGILALYSAWALSCG